MRWLDPLSWLECFDAPSKLFLVEIIHKGNSVDFQDLKDTSLLTDKPTSWHQCRRKIVENQLGLPNLGPVPIHMALAINGGPSPSSVLTAASLFPFQTAHKSTFQHWFSILPGNSKHQKRLSIIHHPLYTFHHPPSTRHHPLDIRHNIPMQGCNSTTPMMLSSLSKVPHPTCSST